jgi:ankyrin repeat protein
MICQFEIDGLFKQCADGLLKRETFASLNHAASITNIDNQSLLEVSVAFKHYDQAKSLLSLPFTDEFKTAALLAATRTGDCCLIQLMKSHISEISTVTRNTAISIACSHGYTDALRLLLQSFPEVDANTHLTDACNSGSVDIVRIMLDHGANAHLSDDGSFMTSFLNHHGSPDVSAVSELLLDNGAVVNPYTWQRYSKRCGSVPLVRKMLDVCPDNMTDVAFVVILHAACLYGHINVAEHVITTAEQRNIKIDFYATFKSVMKPGHSKEVVEFIYNRCNIDLKTLDNKYMYLEGAVKYGCVEIVKALLATGDCNVTEPLATDPFGSTPFPLLGHAHDPAIICMLLEAKAPVTSLALAGACSKLRPDAVRVLLEAGAPPGGDSWAPVETVVTAECTDEQIKDKIELINMLVKAGARTHTVDTALFGCLRSSTVCKPEIVTALHACDPGMIEVVCHDSKPLWQALALDRVPATVVQTLLDLGADLTPGSHAGGRSPLQTVLYAPDADLKPNVRSARRVREKMRLLLHAGADAMVPTSSGLSLPMLLVDSDSHKPPSNPWDNPNYNPFAASAVDADAGDAQSDNYADHVCSVFIGDLLDGVLARG